MATGAKSRDEKPQVAPDQGKTLNVYMMMMESMDAHKHYRFAGDSSWFACPWSRHKFTVGQDKTLVAKEHNCTIWDYTHQMGGHPSIVGRRSLLPQYAHGRLQ